jgi:hypothetical protein
VAHDGGQTVAKQADRAVNKSELELEKGLPNSIMPFSLKMHNVLAVDFSHGKFKWNAENHLRNIDCGTMTRHAD